ncbi:hypothetical protein [Yersinia enterocolitica]|uniref:hypothetical protein n=1 Tax=Yersinia enterocolitica TaxID=630 RepID=UPI0032FE8CF7|nr:hypothetical protein [Yersinia enterocolitica]
MSHDPRGRITPTPPLPYPGSGAAVPAYTYPGSKPRQTLPGIQRPLSRCCHLSYQLVLPAQELFLAERSGYQAGGVR